MSLKMCFMAGAAMTALSVSPAFSGGKEAVAATVEHNHVRTIVYDADMLVRLNFSDQVVTRIDFPENEKISSVFVSDSTKWEIHVTDNSLFIQPNSTEVAGNMHVITSTRFKGKQKYSFGLSSQESSGMSDRAGYVIQVVHPGNRGAV